jgi:hypothetical protein
MNYDLIGKQFFRITVIAHAGAEPKTGLPTWRCRCVCGREHTTTTSAISRRCISPVRCPCSSPPRRPRRLVRHGMSSSREYSEWRALKKRCSTTTAKRKGIAMHPAWGGNFAAFIADAGPCPGPIARLTRIDPDRAWEPGNTRWIITGKTRRRCDARMITFTGRTRSLAVWSRLAGISPGTIHGRLGAGWSVERALRTPVREIEKDQYLRELAAHMRRVRRNDRRRYLRRVRGPPVPRAR